MWRQRTEIRRGWGRGRLFWLPILLGLLTIALLGSGCGGGGDSTTSSSSSYPQIIPRDQFVKKAKEICSSYRETLSHEVRHFYNQRRRETGETAEAVGAIEAVPEVIVPSLKRELIDLEAVGLPKGKAYEAEILWQTLKTVVHEVEIEGFDAWSSERLLPPFRNRAKPFGLQYCIYN